MKTSRKRGRFNRTKAPMAKWGLGSALASVALSIVAAEPGATSLRGLTGQTADVRIGAPAAEKVSLLSASPKSNDLDLKAMAGWALHYLISTPRKELGYEPVFQCYPLG